MCEWNEQDVKKSLEKNEKYLKKLTIFNWRKNMDTKTGYIYLKNNSNQFKFEEKRKNKQFEKERIFEKKYFYCFDYKNANYESISNDFVIAKIIIKIKLNYYEYFFQKVLVHSTKSIKKHAF